MLIHTFDDSKFDELIEKGTVLIDFYADWCGPCKSMKPIIEEIENENPNANFYMVNIDDDMDLAKKFKVMSIPTIIIFKNGQEAKKFIGLTEKNEIVDNLK